MSARDSEMKVINCSNINAIEPFHICPVEDGFKFPELFTPCSVESIEMFMERSKDWMEAHFEDNVIEASFENLYIATEDHFTLDGNGLISICMKINDADKNKHHKIFIYDHLINKLKFLGNIPRHTFDADFDDFVFNHDDPTHVEGVIGALTHDSRYVVVFAYDRHQLSVNVFDICNMSCLLEIDDSGIGFLRCHANGVALNPQGVPQGRFQIAIENENNEIRLWEATTCSEYGARIEDVALCSAYGRNIINARESTLRFTPKGRLLCVAGYFREDVTCKCIFLDAENLDPLCMMSYGLMCSQMFGVFPCFAPCGTKFVMMSVEHEREYFNLEECKYKYFEIPLRLESLKELCKSAILKCVHFSELEKLLLPRNLITFLRGIPFGDVSNEILPKKRKVEKKRCILM